MKIRDKAIEIIAVAYSLVFIFQATFGLWPAHVSRGLYILFALVLTFLINPKRKSETGTVVGITDWVLVVLACVGVGYYILEFGRMARAAGIPLTTPDLFMGILTILLVLEAARRSVGWTLTGIAVVTLLYNYFGYLIPGAFSHRGYSVNRIVSFMYASTDGIFGSVAFVFSTFIFLFIIFGVFIKNAGGGEFFIDLAKATVGRFTGGAGQAAVLSSALLGSIMGSSTANTAVTGSITIPMMIARGYKRHVAGAVEAVVSIGGQFLPPIMGAAAFLMAALIGIPYTEVVVAGLVPAFLFLASMLFQVYLEAKRENIPGIPLAELPDVWTVLKTGGYFLLPIALIIYIIAAGYSPSRAGIAAIGLTFLLSLIRKKDRMSVARISSTLAEGAKAGLVMAVTAGIVGIVVAGIALPGLGMRFSSIVIDLSGGILILALLLTLVASFFLGMGMNVTSAYLLLVTLTAPALSRMGVPILAAHFFVFWTSQLAVITPPVCLSAYVAASLADADPWKTGVHSLRMGLSIYYIPFMFVFIPSLLGIGEFHQIAWNSFTALLGVLSFGAFMQQFLLTRNRIVDQALLGVAALALVFRGLSTDVIGFSAIALVVLLQLMRRRKMAVAA
ncbi:MAG: TRAP transporter fused permease subunit [Spirochaetaceae bacterium]|nr:MAG: TRAP transporter fused permease subunit [Spirochaetaceae bacterium]